MWWKKKEKRIDDFENELEYINRNDGVIVRITQTSRSKQFYVFGDVYSLEILRKNTVLKTYYDREHYEAHLEQDIYGRLILHFYDEEMNFSGDDRVDYLWLFVKNEPDADQMVQVGKLSRLRVPFISGDETGWMSAHEMVDQPH